MTLSPGIIHIPGNACCPVRGNVLCNLITECLNLTSRESHVPETAFNQLHLVHTFLLYPHSLIPTTTHDVAVNQNMRKVLSSLHGI